MLILEEDFRWHLEAFASELFIYVCMYIYIYIYIYIYNLCCYIVYISLEDEFEKKKLQDISWGYKNKPNKILVSYTMFSTKFILV